MRDGRDRRLVGVGIAQVVCLDDRGTHAGIKVKLVTQHIKSDGSVSFSIPGTRLMLQQVGRGQAMQTLIRQRVSAMRT